MKHPIRSLRIAGILLCLAPGLASAAWVSAPSANPVGSTVSITAGGLAPGSTATLAVTDPAGGVVRVTFPADVGGSYVYGYAGALPGKYSAALTGPGGTVLGSADFLCSPP